MNNRFNPLIRYNHLGYGIKFPKIFFVAISKESFFEGIQGFFCIINSKNKICFDGILNFRSYCEYTNEMIYEGDFSLLNEKGKYLINVTFYDSLKNELSKSESFLFEISNDWVNFQLKANIKSFYYQRSGVELPLEFAGKWNRPSAHLDNSLEFHSIMNRKGIWNAHGGWYDAGDYGKYIVNGGVSLSTLLLACEMGFIEKNFKSSFEQPVKLLDEIRFELEFFLRMQDNDGGVFFKVTPDHWDGFLMPIDSDVMQKRYIMGKSTTSTLNFSASLAYAHRVFKHVGENDFAKRCLDASIQAYKWALKNPSVDYPHNTDGSGGYGDEHFDDEFFWTRSMIYRELDSNKIEEYDIDIDVLKKELINDIQKNPMDLGLSWRDTQNFGWIALAFNDSINSFDVELKKNAQNQIKKIADEIIELQNKDSYLISLRKFIWGSNGEIANHALTLLIAYKLTLDVRYKNSGIELLNFIYGRNPMNTSFVTGSAWSSPRYPHHRISHADKIEDPIPGLLVGGINNDRQDMVRKPNYKSELPGFSYTDERASFASNETAINWNAPLTTVLVLLSIL